MNFFSQILKKINPEWPLRLGIGLMYLYSSYDIFYNTAQWKGYIPPWMFHIIIPVMPLELFLKIQAIGEFVLALMLMAWFSGRRSVQIASMLATLEMVFIILFSGIDRSTFRDIGLLGAGLALVIMAFVYKDESHINGTIVSQV